MVALSAVAKHSNDPFQIRYLKVELAARNLDNTLQPFRDISRYVRRAGIGALKKSIDTNDFDVGFYEQSNVNLVLDNSLGSFMRNQGFFLNQLIDRSKVRITAGFENRVTGSNDFEVAFEGIISAETMSANLKREDISYKVISYASLINKLKTRSGAAVNGQDFKTTFFNLLNVTEIKNYLTVDLANINPKLNESVDTGAWFENKQLNEAINKLLIASNSVLLIKNNTIHIQGRDENPTVKFNYYGKGSAFPANIINIKNYNEGDKRVITRLIFEGDSVGIESEQFVIDKYGAKLKTVDLGFITDPDKKIIIGTNIIDEFQFPKPEFEISGPYVGNQVDILDLIIVDNPGYVFNQDPSRYDTDNTYDTTFRYNSQRTGLRIENNIGFKVLAVDHNYTKYMTTLKVRRIGVTEYDGILS
jgi:hypothetical protein